MSNLNLPIYDHQRKWIRESRGKNIDWQIIEYGGHNNDEQLMIFLQQQEKLNYWEKMSCEEWHKLVRSEKEGEEQTKKVDYLSGQAVIHGEGEDNIVTVPTDPNSSWQLYRKKLIDNEFKLEVVDEMERITLRILKRLSVDTTHLEPIKGLVIGNVQSGKTANMAALMAMAADWGWNTFIILSGTIENLRQQTQTRLLNDLNSQGNLNWIGLEHLSKRPNLGQRTQDLYFNETSKQRYFTVCLKNSSRLKKLIQWLQSDSNKQQQMKILVIDDEADQAGINTANVDSDERRTINRLISALVHGKNEKSEEIDTPYRAMNYIGYTATPYANILNEASDESLYPSSFISTLSVSKEYFGPQQIFGLEGGEYDYNGLDIVRVISEEDLQTIKDIHDGYSFSIPPSLRDSICWFMCGVACMRLWGHKKPISMLIHTSQKTDHHSCISSAIKKWLEKTSNKKILKQCKAVWKKETSRYTLEDFLEQYPKYDRPIEKINSYPSFADIEEEVKVLIETEVTNIPLDEDDEFQYHEGIHLCIDNCKNNGVTEDGMYVRLAYPTSDNMPSPAPAFIVVGGATLSRGLTIEGLISTFFLRAVSQADTLMQMGRWFGYRKEYELMPRLWITSKTNDQFKFLADLDQELRDEIHYMDTLGMSPANYGPRVKNTPKASFIRITAKNRMQSAEPTDMNYSGSFNQTYLFDNEKETLLKNIDNTNAFIETLGEPCEHKECNKHANNTIIWRNIDFKSIKQYLSNFVFCKKLRFFDDIDSVLEWIEKITESGKLKNWNVIVAGKKSDNNSIWHLPKGDINKISRSRKKNKNELDDVINIGVLRDPKDIIADVDLEGQSEEIIDMVENFRSMYAKEIRDVAGLETTPQLIIYMIDKESKAAKNSNTREDLNSVEDIVGICVNIPGGKRGVDYVETISIHMNNELFDDDSDLEGTNED